MKNEITINGIVYVKKEEIVSKIELEETNFRVSSVGWRKIEVDGKFYLENKEKDIWELIDDDELYGEQLFTWDSAIRETEKAGKRMPTDKEFNLIEKKDIKNIKYSGYCSANGSYYGRASEFYLWSSSESGTSAWTRDLHYSQSDVYRYSRDKANGWSVRCIKD